MKDYRTLLCFCLLLMVSVSASVTFATKMETSESSAIKIYYDDFLMSFDGKEVYEDGEEVYVPLVEFFQSLGARVRWLDEDGHYQLTLRNDVLEVRGKTLILNGQNLSEFIELRYQNDRTYVPLKALLKELRFGVGYDTEKKGIRISREDQFPLNERGEIIHIENDDLQHQSILLEALSTTSASLGIYYDEGLEEAYRVLVTDEKDRLIYSQAVSSDKLVLEDLRPDTSYKVDLYKNDVLVFEKGFSTFSDRFMSNQIFYEITPWDFEKGLLKVSIFLYNNSDRAMTMKEVSQHVPAGSANIDYDGLEVSGVLYKMTPSAYRIDFDLKAKETAKITYMTDKLVLNEYYLSAMFNQLTLIVDENVSNIIVSLNLPLNWGSSVGIKETSMPNLYKEIADDDYELSHTNIYAYHKELFRVMERRIGPSQLKIIVDRMIEEEVTTNLLKLYLEYVQLWGGYPFEDTYSIMVINGKDDMRTAGPKGQSFAYHRDWYWLAGQQMYKKWSTWDKGIKLTDNGPFEFWDEDMAIYYGYKMANHLGFKNMDDLDSSREGYRAYLLDQEIQSITEGEKSLDHVIRLIWKAHLENRRPMIKAHFRMYIEDVIVGSINDWWDAYMVYREAEPFIERD